MTINDDDQHITVVADRTRIWRSGTSSTVTYIARLRTLLAFAGVLFQPINDWPNSKFIRDRGGNSAIFSAFPSNCAHFEATLRSKDPINVGSAPFYKDGWTLASKALSDAQSYC